MNSGSIIWYHMHPQAGFDPPIAQLQYHTEWDIDTLNDSSHPGWICTLSLQEERHETVGNKFRSLKILNQIISLKNLSNTFLNVFPLKF